ncbi:hypothetical protein [Geobacter sp.]|uniref:hypothetical protein n=1 Tax=Geobacter sp. TaxID=46610 RepID=UPI0027B8E30F|nr:hypothetical protein [Geobacter sp.]
MKIAKTLAVVTSGIILVGCSSLNHNVTINKFDYIGKNKLYSNINIVDGKYYLSNINNIKGDYLLNDLSPTFDIDELTCGKWSYNTPDEKEGIPCDYKESHFRELKTIKSDTIGKNLAYAVLSFGTAIPGAALTGVNYKYSYFNEEKYRQGVTEALNNAGIDRKILFDEYDKWVSGLNKFDDLRKEYLEKYGRLQNNIILKPNIIDKSGFFDNSFDPTTFVSLQQNELPETDIKKIDIPANMAINYFREQDSYFKEYQNKLSDLISYLNLIHNKENLKGRYAFTINAPQTIKSSNTKQEIVYDILINSADFGTVFPVYNMSDKNIVMDFNGNSINLDNKTKEFIQVYSISVYVGKDIKLISLDQPIELPPQAKLARPLSVVRQLDYFMKEEMTFDKITAEKARKSNINFGFAVKYRIVEQNLDKSLYKTTNINVYELLKRKI